MQRWIHSNNIVKIALTLIEQDNQQNQIQNAKPSPQQRIQLKEALYQFISPHTKENHTHLPCSVIDKMQSAFIHLIESTQSVLASLSTKKQQLQKTFSASNLTLAEGVE